MSDEPIKPDPGRKPKRPRDANQLAKRIVDLATGEAEEAEQPDEAAAKRGQLGGQERAARLTPAERSAIAKRAAEMRWAARADDSPGTRD